MDIKWFRVIVECLKEQGVDTYLDTRAEPFLTSMMLYISIPDEITHILTSQ